MRFSIKRPTKYTSTLNALKTSLELLGKLGTPVPFIQATVEMSLQIIRYAETVKCNRKACKELARLGGEIMEALLRATEGAQEHELDDLLKQDIADLQWRLQAILETMQMMMKMRLLDRILHRDEHTAQIAEHRERLRNAIVIFQIKNGISMPRVLIRNHHQVVGGLKEILRRLPPTPTPALRPRPLSEDTHGTTFNVFFFAKHRHISHLKYPGNKHYLGLDII